MPEPADLAALRKYRRVVAAEQADKAAILRAAGFATLVVSTAGGAVVPKVLHMTPEEAAGLRHVGPRPGVLLIPTPAPPRNRVPITNFPAWLWPTLALFAFPVTLVVAAACVPPLLAYVFVRRMNLAAARLPDSKRTHA